MRSFFDVLVLTKDFFLRRETRAFNHYRTNLIKKHRKKDKTGIVF